MRHEIEISGAKYVLTDEHSASSNGVPVLVDGKQALGTADAGRLIVTKASDEAINLLRDAGYDVEDHRQDHRQDDHTQTNTQTNTQTIHPFPMKPFMKIAAVKVGKRTQFYWSGVSFMEAVGKTQALMFADALKRLVQEADRDRHG